MVLPFARAAFQNYMKPKKIFFLTDNFPPERNASASRVYERGLYWIRGGHELTVLTSFPNFPEGKIYDGYENKWFGRESWQGIEVCRVKTFVAPNTGFVFRIFDFLSYMVTSFFAGLFLVKDHDVIVSTSPQLFAAVSAWALAKIKRKPYVFELGDLWPESIKAVGVMKKSFTLRLLETLELFLYRQADVVVALTYAFKENLVARGIDADKIVVVRNGVDLNRHVKKESSHHLRRELQLENQFLIGYLGTMGMAHGLENVIEVAAELHKRQNRHVTFLFVGAGAAKDELVQQAERLGLSNVRFIDSQPKEKIGEYWQMLDLALVHLKNSETFAGVIPSKIFEAMAYGVPILLVAPEGEATQILRDTGAGVCLTDYEKGSFVSLIESLCQNPEQLKNWAAESERAAARFTRERQATEFMQVFEGL